MNVLTTHECTGGGLMALKVALLLPIMAFTAGCTNDPCADGNNLHIDYRLAQPERPERPECPVTGGEDAESESGASTDAESATQAGGDTDTDSGALCETRTPAATGPDLLTASSFAVLAGSTVTNAGATMLEGDLGVSPGSALAGFPPGVVDGTSHANDAIAIQAQTDLTAAYNDAAARPGATPLPADISGMVLAPGVYSAATSLQIASADLTLDGGGDPNATWIFQIGTTLVTSSGADVILTDAGCGRAANVFWQVGSSATIGTGTTFVGTIMADQSITATSGITVDGRLLARVGAVTLDTNLVTVP